MIKLCRNYQRQEATAQLGAYTHLKSDRSREDYSFNHIAQRVQKNVTYQPCNFSQTCWGSSI